MRDNDFQRIIDMNKEKETQHAGYHEPDEFDKKIEKLMFESKFDRILDRWITPIVIIGAVGYCFYVIFRL